jgi:EAL domain-containing protein (putative c-di-GMP-specific phosphodiesterase class I)
MIGLVHPRHPIIEAIYEDEVGLQIGVVGSRRLKTVYQVVYTVAGSGLAPAMLRAGVEISNAPAWSGHPRFDASAANDDFIDRLSALLAVRNYRNADIRELLLYLDVPCGAYSRLGEMGADIRHLAQQANQLEIDPGHIVCELPSHLSEFETLQAMARLLRHCGARIALAHARPDDPLSLWIERLRPDYVRISGDWFGRISSHSASRHLLASLVRAIKDSGAKVLFEWLDSQRLLSAAVEAGADFLQGNVLQPAGLVGTLIDPSNRPMPAPAERSNVVQMGGLVRSHQVR